jgi:hypothetical protein
MRNMTLKHHEVLVLFSQLYFLYFVQFHELFKRNGTVSVNELHHFYAAPALAPTPTLEHSMLKFVNGTKVKINAARVF